jgi:ribosome-associated protein
MTAEENKILNELAQALYDKKAENILVLDARQFSTMSDYFVIAEGSIERHVSALSRTVVETFEEKPLHVEGEVEGDWVVVDYGNIVIHLMTHEMREKYDLESLWREAKIVDVKIETGIKVKPQRKAAK